MSGIQDLGLGEYEDFAKLVIEAASQVTANLDVLHLVAAYRYHV